MSKKQDEAVETFKSGFNCAQSVLSTFSDLLESNPEQLRSVSVGFGGGMGKLQETCGAATGAYMLFSIYCSNKTADNEEAKAASALMIRKFSQKFNQIEGSTNCKTLIGVDLQTEEGMKEATDKGLFDKVCGKCVGTAVRIIEDMLGEKASISD
ncbi:C-GCAxxG-C-C family protein [Bacteroidota bacterium]